MDFAHFEAQFKRYARLMYQIVHKICVFPPSEGEKGGDDSRNKFHASLGRYHYEDTAKNSDEDGQINRKIPSHS